MSRYPPLGALGPRLIAHWALATQTAAVDVGGLEHLPRAGPALIVARHYHHLLDGAVLLTRLPRPVHIVVALDWTANARQRRWMERACALAGWPVVLRPAALPHARAFAASELMGYLRRGLRDAAHLLRDGRVVVVFPEGYPLVDPTPGDAPRPARDGDGFLPFAAGYRTIANLAQRAGARVPLVPLGFAYARTGERWRIDARLGAPLAPDTPPDAVERAVRALSQAADGSSG